MIGFQSYGSMIPGSGVSILRGLIRWLPLRFMVALGVVADILAERDLSLTVRSPMRLFCKGGESLHLQVRWLGMEPHLNYFRVSCDEEGWREGNSQRG